MSVAQVGKIPAVRACITSFRTTEADVEWVVSEMNRLSECGAYCGGGEKDADEA